MTSVLLANGHPAASGYTRGFAFLAVVTMLAVVAALFIPTAGEPEGALGDVPHLEHAELALVPGGTIAEG